ncbi:aminopeptidase N [Streptomyces orinoci]|uniref:Aminopeptidase N n=1 Tax=Streptomyces orinoci TaxID=67339 RepID=A0ABV3JYT8_STRON|nr:aminopeptidase N [Streptomyces orinoci]
MPALTHTEAVERAQLLDVHGYDVHLDLTTGEETFRSSTTIDFTARTTGDTFVELKPHTLHHAELDGRPLDPATLEDNRLPLTGLTPGRHRLHIEADMRYSRTGEGMHRFTDPADGESYVYTQLFLDEVERVFPSFNQPDLKAVFNASVTAPAEWTVLGNGIATREGNRWTLAPTPPLSTYFVAFAAGPWHSVHTEHAGLPFGLHCRRSLAPHLDSDAEELFGITRACFDRFHQTFDEPYPFDSYDQAFVPEFNAGAMENPGLVTFRDEFLYRSAVTDTERQTRGVVIAHEMAHMWFGDLVTLKWWDDIWLNESFAEYMGYQVLSEATRFTGPWTEFAISRKSWGYDADQRPTTHPVAPDPEAVHDTAAALLNFDGISYSKGAGALRQLVAWLGEKDFLAGINDHFARHRFGNATLADFIDSLDRVSDRDVHDWARHWLRTSGVDTLTPEVSMVSEENGGWRLDLHHHGSRPHQLRIACYDHQEDGRLTAREPLTLQLTADGGTHTHHFTGTRPDLLLLNDQDLTYAKIRLDPHSWNTALNALSALPDPLNRAVTWNAARDMVRDAQLAPAAYLQAARAHLPRETDNAIARGVLTFARTQLTDHYTTAHDRPAALATLADTARELLEHTGPHDALRLTAVRALIDSTTEPGILHDWLRTETVPGGPALDPELRWRTLTRLAVLGALTTTEIDAELRRDPSATGREGAARCRAALPDPAAKEAAWQAMYGGDELSNYLFTATAQGFWQAEQLDLLRPFAERYFTDAVALAARRGPALAITAGREGFPRILVEDATLRLTEDCLREAAPVPALRRQLTERLDDLRRALRVRRAP